MTAFFGTGLSLDLLNDIKELTSYIEKSVDSGTLLFKLNEVHDLYVNRLKELGIKKQVNKTRLKFRLLGRFSEAQEKYAGKNIVLIFKEGMQNMLKEALTSRDFSKEAVILANAATIIRKDIFSHQGFKSTGMSGRLTALKHQVSCLHGLEWSQLKTSRQA